MFIANKNAMVGEFGHGAFGQAGANVKEGRLFEDQSKKPDMPSNFDDSQNIYNWKKDLMFFLVCKGLKILYHLVCKG